ncbi:uncharacterized protein LOC129312158 [Prosopis cineraria]|uniref:uncharacterized protein LOC129312158 n=1 Tax=Prosopis cineraria TaxID=364024 RepID=UPI00240FFE33|nr:uncharacterized protein LOC129312158 [Prosopis cineraria]
MDADSDAVSCSSSYYSILGVDSDSSLEEIRRAYRKLAMRWHPDRWTRTPSLLGEAKRKFQQIQEAYSVLSDQSKRTMYDAGLYDPQEEEDEGFYDFVQELKTQVSREERVYSIEELQSMLMEMVQGFEDSSWHFGTSPVEEESQCSKRARRDSKANVGSHFQEPGFHFYETRGYCS